MTATITCTCGYSGPSLSKGQQFICPLCQEPAVDSEGGLDQEPELSPVGVDMPPVPPWGVPPPTGLPAVASGGFPMHATASERPTTYRIPCPRGHLLKTAENMLNQRVVCPKCNEFFIARITDSVQYKREVKRKQDIQEAKQAKFWLRCAIVAAVLIVASFIAMITMSVMRKPKPVDAQGSLEDRWALAIREIPV